MMQPEGKMREGKIKKQKKTLKRRNEITFSEDEGCAVKQQQQPE